MNWDIQKCVTENSEVGKDEVLGSTVRGVLCDSGIQMFSIQKGHLKDLIKFLMTWVFVK